MAQGGRLALEAPMSRFIPPLWVLRAGAWFCVALIGFLSVIPHEVEVRTGLPGGIEHVIAYAGTAGLLRLAYPSWVGGRIVAALFVYAVCLEGVQSFVPGRNPSVTVPWPGVSGQFSAL